MCDHLWSIFSEDCGRSPAVIVPHNDLKGIADAHVRHEKGLEVMKSVLSLAEDVQTKIYLDIRICNHGHLIMFLIWDSISEAIASLRDSSGMFSRTGAMKEII